MPGTKKSFTTVGGLQGVSKRSISFNFHDSLVLKIGG